MGRFACVHTWHRMNDLKARLSESQLLATSLQKKSNEDERLIATLRFRNLENARDVEFMREKIRALQARKEEREQDLLEAEKTANAHLTATNAELMGSLEAEKTAKSHLTATNAELMGSLEAEKTANAHLTATNAAQDVVRSKSPFPFCGSCVAPPLHDPNTSHQILIDNGT